ncbi:hypothetical protein M6B38_207270 [Iris pallida]|uniref:Uncharacterized protein n=1 Tax=Iris pallida TaxID=29817 RepID=A0AAX6E661_IRIPA|nr:hypothetical protein M6B38_207270 [Iris pallida]
MEHCRNDQPTSGQLKTLKRSQSRRNTEDRLKTEGFFTWLEKTMDRDSQSSLFLNSS